MAKRVVHWSRGGSHFFSAIVEATYQFNERGAVALVDSRAASKLVAASDVPAKAFAELIVEWEPRPISTYQILGVSVARGADVVVHKRFARLATGDVVEVDDPSVRPKPTDRRDEDDLRRYQSAPADQWTEEWRGGEQILLTGQAPGELVHLRVPAAHGFAVMALAGTESRHIPLRGDTLTVRPAERLVTVTFRGCVEWPPQAGPPRELRDGELQSGLMPCDDVEATLGLPLAWRAALRRGQVPRPPAVDPLEVTNSSGFTVGSIRWSWEPPKLRRVVIVKGTFEMIDRAEATMLDEQDPLAPDHPVEGGKAGELRAASDLAPFKVKADVHLAGTAHAPPGATSALVRVEVGALHAELIALGPRQWMTGGVPSAPAPFQPVPLVWSNAFGGPDHAENPAGTGATRGSPPPLLERRDQAALPQTAHRAPACLAPISPAWAPRASRLGSFDDSWLKERWPYFPRDIDPGYFQAAPPGLIADRIDEGAAYALRSVRDGGGGFEGRLPGVRPRAFVSMGGAEPFQVRLMLDTVSFDTDAAKLHLVWRGSYELPSDRPRPIEKLVVFKESAAEPSSGELAAVKVAAMLSPPWDDAMAFVRPENRPVRIEEVLARAKKAPRGPFVAPAASFPKTLTPPTREEVMRRAKEGKLARADLTDVDLSGVDLSGADLSRAILRRANLRGAKLAGAILEGAVLDSADATDACFDGAQLGRATLHGASLRGATFRGAQIGRASFEHAQLERTVWANAAGERTRFAYATLDEAVFDGAVLEKADFSYSSLRRATFQGAHLADAKFIEAKAEESRFDEALLEDARFPLALLGGASFRKAQAAGAVWECATLSNACFAGAEIKGALLEGARADKADFAGARGERRASARRISGALASTEPTSMRRHSKARARLARASCAQTCTKRRPGSRTSPERGSPAQS